MPTTCEPSTWQSKWLQAFDSLSNYNRFQPSQTPTRGVSQESGSNVTLPGEEGNQRGGGGGLGGGGGGFGGGQGGGLGGGGGQGGGFGGGQGGQGGANTQLTPGQGLIPDTITHITFDPTDNSLVVTGTNEDDINKLQNIIAQFDVRPRQVQIKVEFITTTENLDQSLGYNINYSRGTVIAGMAGTDFLRASDPVFLTYASGDAVFRLRTRLAQGEGRVVTAPIVRTMNNTPASVFAITQDWILTSQTTVSNGAVITTVNPIALQLGTGLSVTPRINADNTITMGLSPQVTSVTGTRQVSSSGSSFELPIQTSELVQVVVNVKDKETIVLGGLNAESTNSTTTRVPVLSDLPIIGQFFKKVVKGRNSSELLIFVTPVILEDDDSGIAP
jgi:general secretion pathway protein D